MSLTLGPSDVLTNLALREPKGRLLASGAAVRKALFTRKSRFGLSNLKQKGLLGAGVRNSFQRSDRPLTFSAPAKKSRLAPLFAPKTRLNSNLDFERDYPGASSHLLDQKLEKRYSAVAWEERPAALFGDGNDPVSGLSFRKKSLLRSRIRGLNSNLEFEMERAPWHQARSSSRNLSFDSNLEFERERGCPCELAKSSSRAIGDRG